MKIGCAGFCESRKRYFSEFSVVEVQHSFYNPISLGLLRKWREEAPVGFEFTLKALQIITHPPSSPTYRRFKGKRPKRGGFFLPSKEVFEAWDVTLREAKALDANIVIFQLPPSFCPSHQNLDNMENFFKYIEREELKLGIELRCEEWRGKIREICERFGLFHVVDPFTWEKEWGKLNYFRLHGKGNYKYRFKDEDLSFLVNKLNRDSYVIFNNIYSITDARRFKDFLF